MGRNFERNEEESRVYVVVASERTNIAANGGGAEGGRGGFFAGRGVKGEGGARDAREREERTSEARQRERQKRKSRERGRGRNEWKKEKLVGYRQSASGICVGESARLRQGGV